jgi:hypothetical protein
MTDTLPTIIAILPILLLFIVCAFVVVALVLLVLAILDRRTQLQTPHVQLEIVPPVHIEKTPAATQKLFTVLHGLEASKSLWDRLLKRRVIFALEIHANKTEGIRYIASIPLRHEAAFKHAIISYLPQVQVRPTRIESFGNSGSVQILDLKQTGHFAYPLHTQFSLEEHDPMAYLTGAMTKMQDTERLALQLVIAPARIKKAAMLSRRLLHNEELLYQLGKRKIPLLGNILDAIGSLFFTVLDGIGAMVSGIPSKALNSQDAHSAQVAAKLKPARVLTPLEQQLALAVNLKLNEPLYHVSIRAYAQTNERSLLKPRIQSIKDWLAVFTVSRYQSLKARVNNPSKIKMPYRLYSMNNRLPAFLAANSCILSASEMADLYHFPYGIASEGLAKSHSKILPAPLAVKNKSDADIVVGQNIDHETETLIGLTASERERHTYIIGGTGSGKTTLLKYKIVQDIKNGKSVALIDPHGDLAEELLGYIPPERLKDVIYFNPDDLSYPIGMNILELKPGLSGDDLLREKDLITESVVSVFRKIFSEDDSGGHRIEYVLRNAIQTALTIEGATLFTVYDLLNDPKYCKKIVRTLEDENLKKFWKNELGKAGGFQQVKMVAGITAKIGRFLFSASAKRVLEQQKSTIDFDDVLNGKILICNFSKGLLGEDTSQLFGITVLARLQIAALRRARLKEVDRQSFYLYVDEFQNFATASFVQMLSEARKYKLFLTMAEQSTSQQSDQQTVNIILANVGTVICFRTGNPADERLMLPRFRPYLEEGDIANLPSYTFYMRISGMKAQEPFSGETLLLDEPPSEAIRSRTVAASRQNFATQYTLKSSPKVVSKKKQDTKLKVEKTASPLRPGDA